QLIWTAEEGHPLRVVIPPGIVHAYQNRGEKSGLVLNFPNQLYRGWGKKEEVDEIRWEERKDSPFVVE
ncbi:MAG TPA: dTDP-4-dehydrorhamnose 3,5-epimerase, partial [Candidatus Atribacteria bacterium]|nr:dTDP-4-dehydrorhamnose 3,5-epimerase [Candidatus Atribacteria bacterium]